MRAWLALTLLAAGVAIGFFASRAGDDEDATSSSRSAPTAAAHPAPAAPPAAAAQQPPPEPPPAFSLAPLAPTARTQLRKGGFWHRGCPVPLSGLALLRVTYRGFDRQPHTGELVVNVAAGPQLERVFRRLYKAHFPIRHIGFDDFYGPRSERPADGDVTGAFECRQAVPSPCTGGLRSRRWSMHAYGLAVDLNPTENPYIGCGQSRDPATKPYRDRSPHRRGMVDARAIGAFGSVGWGWGGAWTGNTKDYMHFSATGH